MRILPTLLLLLVLPGLLLPAGFVLHLCRCAPAVAGASAGSCCSTPAPAPEAEACGCCCGDREDAGSRGEGPGQCAHGDGCDCLVVAAPEHKPEPAPLGGGPDVHCPLAHVGPSATLPPLGLTAHRRAPVEHSRPPPPDRHRNLPLLL